MNIFSFLAPPVATLLRGIHAALSTFLPDGSGWAWGLSIVLLTVGVRLLLFPLFVKQIRSQRRMQELAPQIKALQAKHKGDRETLNTEMMKLYKDNGTNPISGCLPLIVQLPVFFALFRVMREFRPTGAGHDQFVAKYGFPKELIEQGARAKIFGAPLSAAFNSPADLLHLLNGNGTIVKVVAVVMIVTMGATTFFTQKQMMARNASADPQQAQVQKILLYVLPFSFAVFGFTFPIGVLLYWLTTNVWSMGQQRYVIARMPPVVVGGKAVAGTGGSSAVSLTKPAPSPAAAAAKGLLARFLTPPAKDAGSTSLRKGGDLAAPAAAPAPAAAVPTPPSGAAKNGLNRPAGQPRNDKRSAGARKNKSRKGGRR